MGNDTDDAARNVGSADDRQTSGEGDQERSHLTRSENAGRYGTGNGGHVPIGRDHVEGHHEGRQRGDHNSRRTDRRRSVVRKAFARNFVRRSTCRCNGRGENAIKERRAELRRVAEARIDAGVQEANRRLEAWQFERSTVLLAGQLSSDEASHFFKSLPTPEELLPQVQIPEVAPRRIRDIFWTPE